MTAAAAHAIVPLPNVIARGILVLAICVFIGGFAISAVRPRRTGESLANRVFESGNVGQHALPLLVLVLILVVRPPGPVPVLAKLVVPALVASLYLIDTYRKEKSVTENYGFRPGDTPTAMLGFALMALLAAHFV